MGIDNKGFVAVAGNGEGSGDAVGTDNKGFVTVAGNGEGSGDNDKEEGVLVAVGSLFFGGT